MVSLFSITYAKPWTMGVEMEGAGGAYSGMNVHHLELFYHVAKHGGISEAVRKMPYGIQQPAVSGQILQLEETLGLKLFQRRPFHLTPAGRELFAFVEPFFGRLGETGERLRGETSHRLRLAAPATILRGHFPNLLVPASYKLASPRQLWKEIEPEETLISLPPNEVISKLFRQGLEKLGVSWTASVEISSLDLLGAYVSAGFGIGVSVLAPGAKPPAGVKVFPLTNFPPLIIAALWQDRLPPVAESFLNEAKRRAEEMQRG